MTRILRNRRSAKAERIARIAAHEAAISAELNRKLALGAVA